MEENNFVETVNLYNTPVFYMGIDCSSRAVHAVVLDFNERIVAKGKWSSTCPDFLDRFPEMLMKFQDNLSKIKVTMKAAVESAIFIQNPKSTMEIASVVGVVKFVCHVQSIEYVSNTAPRISSLVSFFCPSTSRVEAILYTAVAYPSSNAASIALLFASICAI